MSHFKTRLEELKTGWLRVAHASPVKPLKRPAGRLAPRHAEQMASVLIFGLQHALEQSEAGNEAETWIAFKKMQAWLNDNMGSTP